MSASTKRRKVQQIAWLEPEQFQRLHALARSRGLAISVILREAVDDVIEKYGYSTRLVQPPPEEKETP
jgi:predicted DNA-binding protein